MISLSADSRRFAGVLLIASVAGFVGVGAGQTAKETAAVAQPETLDLDMYARIRKEGIFHSRVMEYSSGLFDGIGPRLTGSPNMKKANDWTRDQLTRMGCVDAHEESWGDFGMGWRQIGTSALMTAPDTATLLAQATPWSPATPGAVTAEVIAVPELQSEADLAQWKGKLAGKILLYGSGPKIDPDNLPQMEHYDTAKLKDIYDYPLDGYNGMTREHVLHSEPAVWEMFFKQRAFKEKVGAFLKSEKAVAVLLPGGSGGVILDDTRLSIGWLVYRPEHRQAIPGAVIADEAFGRMSRLLAHGVPVSMSLNIQTEFTGDHEPGLNTIAEIAGTDPKLKDQVVMLGGHLDSWIAGTGATDDGAGAVIAMEAMRILNAVGVKPRRTIRIGLWGGEEQGIFGSLGYVRDHFATLDYSTKPEEMLVPEYVREQVGPPKVKRDHKLLSVYFNVDGGTGKLLGIYAEGNAAAGELFEQWGRPLKDLGFTTVSERPTGSSDHVPFDQVGLPGFQFIQDPRDYETRAHHTNQDVYERLSEPDLEQAAVVLATFVYDAAMRDQMMPRKPMPQPELEEKQHKPLEGLFPGGTRSSR
jgi:carboxypeptidase Q